MVPPYSHRVSRVRRYSGYRWLFRLFVYRTLTFFGWTSHSIPANALQCIILSEPRVYYYSRFGLFRVRSPLLAESHFDFSSSPYLDVSVQAVSPHIPMYSVYDDRTFPPAGLLHSDICGSMPAYGSPIAYRSLHVLLRLSSAKAFPLALFVA